MVITHRIRKNFDCGISTCKAIMNYGRGTEPLLCGEKGEFDNGNGSLMRILPAALYYGMDALPKDWLAVIPKKEWIMELAEKCKFFDKNYAKTLPVVPENGATVPFQINFSLL